MRFDSFQFIRFIVCGFINTSATWILYIFLCKTMHYQVAWMISYVAGIVVAYYLNIILVFRGNSNIKKMAQYPLAYLLQYLVSSLLMFLFVKVVRIPDEVVPILVAIFLIPVSFVMNRFILEDRKSR